MKLLISCFIFFTVYQGCTSGSTSNLPNNPSNNYKIVNDKANDGVNRNYDVYVNDASKITLVNEYLKSTLDKDEVNFIQINYYDDEMIAKTYMDKQFSTTTSEKEKDKLFVHYLANYKHNKNTGYSELVFMH